MSREAKILAHNIQNNPEDFEGEKLEQSLDRFAKAYHQDQVTKQSFNRCGSGDNVCKCTNENECGYTATHSPLTDVTGPPPKESGTGMKKEIAAAIVGLAMKGHRDPQGNFVFDYDTSEKLFEALENYDK